MISLLTLMKQKRLLWAYCILPIINAFVFALYIRIYVLQHDPTVSPTEFGFFHPLLWHVVLILELLGPGALLVASSLIRFGIFKRRLTRWYEILLSFVASWLLSFLLQKYLLDDFLVFNMATGIPLMMISVYLVFTCGEPDSVTEQPAPPPKKRVKIIPTLRKHRKLLWAYCILPIIDTFIHVCIIRSLMPLKSHLSLEQLWSYYRFFCFVLLSLELLGPGLFIAMASLVRFKLLKRPPVGTVENLLCCAVTLLAAYLIQQALVFALDAPPMSLFQICAAASTCLIITCRGFDNAVEQPVSPPRKRLKIIPTLREHRGLLWAYCILPLIDTLIYAYILRDFIPQKSHLSLNGFGSYYLFFCIMLLLTEFLGPWLFIATASLVRFKLLKRPPVGNLETVLCCAVTLLSAYLIQQALVFAIGGHPMLPPYQICAAASACLIITSEGVDDEQSDLA